MPLFPRIHNGTRRLQEPLGIGSQGVTSQSLKVFRWSLIGEDVFDPEVDGIALSTLNLYVNLYITKYIYIDILVNFGGDLVILILVFQFCACRLLPYVAQSFVCHPPPRP